jgi:hypothetical protein
MLVELDAFSGRPNPRWQLDERDRQELLRLQGQLTETSGVPPAPPALGYRGFRYADRSGVYRAYQGYVLTPLALLADPSLSVERFLIDRLPPEFAPVRMMIAAALRQSGTELR